MAMWRRIATFLPYRIQVPKALFQAMSLSVKKTYVRAYFDAKTDAGREKKMAWMVDRLNKNLKPM